MNEDDLNNFACPRCFGLCSTGTAIRSVNFYNSFILVSLSEFNHHEDSYLKNAIYYIYYIYIYIFIYSSLSNLSLQT